MNLIFTFEAAFSYLLNYIVILFVFRYSNPNAAQQQSSSSAQPGEDLTPDYMNVLVKTYALYFALARTGLFTECNLQTVIHAEHGDKSNI